MKNPLSIKTINPYLFLIQGILLLGFGIITLVDGDLAFSMLKVAAAISLAVLGISHAGNIFAEKKYIFGISVLIGFFALAVIIFIFPAVFTVSVGELFGLWFFFTGIARALICLQCWLQNLKGKFRYAFSSIISIVFGSLLLFNPSLHIKTVFQLSGIYLILYAVSLLTDFLSDMLRWGNVSDSVKRHIRIALPMFITAFLPSRLIDEFNEYFLTHQESESVIHQNKLLPGQEDGHSPANLEVFIHLSDKGIGRMGHVDIRLDNTVYSYGCYDQHSTRMLGMVSDGTIAVAPSEPYKRHCLSFEKKVLVGFGLILSEKQKEAVTTRLDELKSETEPWLCDQQKSEQGILPVKNYTDAASELYKATGAHILKVVSGPFKTYFAINTNCVKLADSIIGPSGIDLLTINGISTPGSYFTLLNEMFERKNTIVVERTIYADKKRGKTLSMQLCKKEQP